jgi:hypothetical protein
LDELEPEKRSEILEDAYLFILRPANREKIYELLAPENAESTYLRFRAACEHLAQQMEERLLVTGIVHFTLATLLHRGDTTGVEQIKAIRKSCWGVS